MISTRLRWLITGVTGVILVTGLFVAIRSPQNLLGRVLEGDELFRVQAESDFDRDGDIDFLDFTVFSAYYEET